ncbi:MAG TPA: DUF1926 domain-containing protein [Candidatus Hydrogenedentes bacterium]|nr:DUF1926 domain-containing protein [Candidatus Hydrogenedentota bacterium]HOS02774.1 DUF1926 domain-containing protein [Candidatus Hydrogenedentota bacterium]
MAKGINLILGCHSHQPVGNIEHVFELAYERAYKPFLDVLERYPDVRFTLHYTGPLLDWFLKNQPVFIGRLRALADAGQIEIMGGAYYEPLLCTIPERDALAQIARMNAFCDKHFGAPPRGMWLTERVWEPRLPSVLKRSGIEYTALDDAHFLCSGLSPDKMFGYYVTEDEGETLRVFPILEKLRYLVPFHQVYESMDYLRDLATEEGTRCAVLHDDGEKFGIWPETYRSVYEKGWLEEFFQALTDNKEWVQSVTYSDYMARIPALGRTYLTCASYEEMMEWALPVPTQRLLARVLQRIKQDPDRAKEDKLFVRGGFWRNFLTKYPESNTMQKKMLRVSGKLERLRATKDRRLSKAEQLLHEGQCNCAYWHGVFGGLYLNHLRTAIYDRLIAAERVLDAIAHKDDNWMTVESLDFDGDGRDEVILENAHLSLGLSPLDGGTLFEWSFKDKCFNFANTLTRRDELYHDALRMGNVQIGEIGEGDQSIHELVRAKESGLEEFLVYDPCRRVCLRDHFYPLGITADRLWAVQVPELGDFATGEFTAKEGKTGVALTREGVVFLEEALPVTVTKHIALKRRASSFEIRYDIFNASSRRLQCLFGVEFGLNLLSGKAFDKYYRSDDRDLGYAKLGERGCDKGLSHIALRDDWLKLECGLRFDAPADIHRFAIDTVSQSEGGQERIYQGSVVVPCWRLDCAPGQHHTVNIVAQAVEIA